MMEEIIKDLIEQVQKRDRTIEYAATLMDLYSVNDLNDYMLHEQDMDKQLSEDDACKFNLRDIE